MAPALLFVTPRLLPRIIHPPTRNPPNLVRSEVEFNLVCLFVWSWSVWAWGVWGSGLWVWCSGLWVWRSVGGWEFGVLGLVPRIIHPPRGFGLFV